jgi:ribosome modulation factor
MPNDPRQTTPKNPGWEGMAARERGDPVDTCPYDPGPQRTAWVTGWYIASPREAFANGK